MARVSREQTELNRLAIEEAAARLFREHGFGGVTVADLMAAAGLTHGGFYGHFTSKDELAAVACAHSFSQSNKTWRAHIARAGTARAARDQIVSNYLSERQRDNAGRSCPLASFAVDVGREPSHKPVRAAFLHGAKELAKTLTQLMPGRNARKARADALAALSTLVGALVLARATRGDIFSDEVLAAARGALSEVEPAS